MSLKYNYVIFGSDWDLYKHSYSDLFDKEYVRYYDTIESCFGRLAGLFKIHFAEPSNKLFRLPFKNIWNSLYFKNDFHEKDKPICFVFMGYWPRIVEQTNIIKYLKKQNKNSRFVLFSQDLVKTKHTLYSHEPLQLKHFDYYDLVLSFDQGDCEEYGFIYHPLVFSSYKGIVEDMPESDIYFLGQPKDRLNEIYELYHYLVTRGLKVDMFLTKVPVDKRDNSGDIKYINWMSYQDNLQHAIHSKCILEVMQKGGKGYTQRCLEAIGLRKKLLTNNTEVAKSDFYDSRLISTFNTIDDIDDGFLDRIKTSEEIQYVNEKDISPLELLSFIDRRL